MDGDLVVNNLAEIVDRVLVVEEENVEQVVPPNNPALVRNIIQQEQQVPAYRMDPNDHDNLYRTPRRNRMRHGYMSPDSTTNTGAIRRERRRPSIPPTTPTPFRIRLRERAPRRHRACNNCIANYHRGYVPPLLFLYENGRAVPYDNHNYLLDARFNRENNISPSDITIEDIDYGRVFENMTIQMRPMRLHF